MSKSVHLFRQKFCSQIDRVEIVAPLPFCRGLCRDPPRYSGATKIFCTFVDTPLLFEILTETDVLKMFLFCTLDMAAIISSIRRRSISEPTFEACRNWGWPTSWPPPHAARSRRRWSPASSASLTHSLTGTGHFAKKNFEVFAAKTDGHV